MPLNSKDIKICKDALQFEYDGVKEFFENNLLEGWSLVELDSKEDAVVSKFQILLRKGLTVSEIISNIRKLVSELRRELQQDYDQDISDAEVQSESLFALDHVSFQWTKSMLHRARYIQHIINIQKRFRGNKSRLTSKAMGRITIKQKLADWSEQKKQMIKDRKELLDDSMSEEEKKKIIDEYKKELEEFYKTTYLKGAKRKNKRSKKKGSKKKIPKKKTSKSK